MSSRFADTSYWIALVYRRDPHRAAARHAQNDARRLGIRVVTTDEVLVETLAFFSAYPASVRSAAAETVVAVLNAADVEVIPQSRDTFLAGLDLYRRRPDKYYSLVDCISMATMRQRGITEALTYDHHFEQEGFVAELRR